MRVIPVIDLKGGVVVQARQGRRDSYRPIISPLCASSDVYQVLDAFLGIYPFDRFYIADLDALTGDGNHVALLAALLNDFPRIEFWIDCGYVNVAEMINKPANYRPVLGSESLNENTITELALFNRQYILSLDYFGEEERGPQALFSNATYWPAQVIIMTLGRVGGEQGPDYQRLERFCRNYSHTEFIAAGGVRGYGDLMRLKASGIQSVLIASALHNGSLTTDDIGCLQD